MGSTISSAVRTGTQTTLKETAAKSQRSTLDPRATTQMSTSKPHPAVTARVRSNKPPPYHRKTTEEWSEALKQISGAIKSSSWEGEVKPHMLNQHDSERHSAQRSDLANQRLPGRQKVPQDKLQRDKNGVIVKPEGRLTQNQVLQIFNLLRGDSEQWNASSLAAKYKLNEDDVSNLLLFSRTYLARLDADGQVRGYFNINTENTIHRFEKD